MFSHLKKKGHVRVWYGGGEENGNEFKFSYFFRKSECGSNVDLWTDQYV